MSSFNKAFVKIIKLKDWLTNEREYVKEAARYTWKKLADLRACSQYGKQFLFHFQRSILTSNNSETYEKQPPTRKGIIC